MRKIYLKYLPLLATGLFLSMLIASCKKEPKVTPVVTPAAPIATLGLYELDSGVYKRVFIAISKVGNLSVTYYSIFDTGSTGMTLDATSLLPTTMITSSGITVPGDSVNVNGITVTNQTSIIAYGDAQSEVQEFGNLAYTTVELGDQNGNYTTGRIPIFLYYKIVDVTTGQKLPPHSNDVFGVGPGVSFANSTIASPLSYFTEKNGGISGFKLALFNNEEFTTYGNYVAGLLTIGLVPKDISSSSGFALHPLTYYSQGGYSADIPATITYAGNTVQATVLFDTGTPAISLIANQNAPSNVTTLPDGTSVTLTTAAGFSYTYTVNNNVNNIDDLTQVTKPSYTGDPRTIFSINFFTDNEYMLDYKDHEIGLKNN
jgi:hypothetical protein